MISKSNIGYKVSKRLFDIFVSISILMTFSPIMIIVALIIKLQSQGKIFYLAKRAGIKGEMFSMYKFRTMHENYPYKSKITSKNDPRIFPFGKLIRQLKIDELPQFINVLRGEMSIVGPRPEDIEIVKKNYNKWMLETLLVPPGITGPGAIYGYSISDDVIEDDSPVESYINAVLEPKIALERAYLNRANFLSDLKYILLTLLAIFYMLFNLKIKIPKIDLKNSKNFLSK